MAEEIKNKYEVLETIEVDGTKYEAGDDVELTEAQAAEFGDNVKLADDESGSDEDESGE